ncbi:unnamed protein product [Albugo candida]|uniref:Uncharacterized protein n=1 Tax=Albugo candida TaxID=65357 RepID=A0A024G178_9STRA|nr:unnamed protein product [Albugo candida]|eukprot:CCI40612.1 unnamed protein product [Albugo candida]
MAFRIADSHVFQVISNLRVASHVCLHGGASTRKYRFNVLPALTQVPNRHISLNFGSADFLIWVYVMLLRRNIHLSVVNYVDYYLLCNSNSHRLEFHLDLLLSQVAVYNQERVNFAKVFASEYPDLSQCVPRMSLYQLLTLVVCILI